jgi:hypothetical protein
LNTAGLRLRAAVTTIVVLRALMTAVTAMAIIKVGAMAAGKSAADQVTETKRKKGR